MKKDIKDYLHFYIGQQVARLHKDEDKEFFEVAKLVGISQSEIDRNKTVSILDVGIDHFHEWFIEETKPILRPLEAMTADERKELWRFVFSQGHGKDFNDKFKDFTGHIKSFTETTYYSVPRLVLMQGVERLGIESDGTIWADCDLHNWRHNQHEVTRWLLSKNLDIFDLHTHNLCLYRNSSQELN